MDSWPFQPHRHKRSFSEMSQQATLSPSPIHNLFSLANFSRFTGSAPVNNNISGPSDRRRISHPHNPPQMFRQPSESIAERAQIQQRPRLQHQASQTLTIDLTDEPEDLPIASRNRDRARSQRPPHLGRSDAQALENIIDLTDDNEIEITAFRQLTLPRPNTARPIPQARPLRIASPSLFLPHSPPARERNRFPLDHGPLGFFDRPAQPLPGVMDAATFLQYAHGAGFDHFEPFNNAQAMPGQMDYQRGAFVDQKPDHLPPPPAKEGFTRSPTEDDIVVCPSCDEELVHKKDTEEPLPLKKGGKARTRKEREEHPFWVVKECGHVYCNNCYQTRTVPGRVAHQAFLPERHAGKAQKKSPHCAVEDCDSEVKGKENWVGVFL